MHYIIQPSIHRKVLNVKGFTYLLFIGHLDESQNQSFQGLIIHDRV